MSMFSIFNISGTAIGAQSQRLNVVASNLANVDAVAGPDGKAYVCNNGGCFHWEDVMGLTIPGHCPSSWSGGSIQRVDLETGEVETLYTESTGNTISRHDEPSGDA